MLCVSLPRSASTFTVSLIKQNHDCYIQPEAFKPVRPKENIEYVKQYNDDNVMTFTKFVSIVNVRQAAYFFKPVNEMLRESHSFAITPRADYVDHYLSLLINVYYDLFNPLTDVKMSSVYSSGAEKRNKALSEFFDNKSIDLDIIDSLMYSLSHNVSVMTSLMNSVQLFSYNQVIEQSSCFLEYVKCNPHKEAHKFKQTSLEEKKSLLSIHDYNVMVNTIQKHVHTWYKEDGSIYEL